MPNPTKDRPALESVKPAETRKSAMEIEVERLAKLSPEEMSVEDVRALTRVRDCRASLVSGENELAEVKERVKLRKKTLDHAVKDACTHLENRQLAKQLTLGI